MNRLEDSRLFYFRPYYFLVFDFNSGLDGPGYWKMRRLHSAVSQRPRPQSLA